MPVCISCRAVATTGSGISFHRFPKIENRQSTLRKWKEFIGKENDWDPQNARICSQHFEEDDYKWTMNGPRILMPNAVPSKCLSNCSTNKSEESHASIETQTMFPINNNSIPTCNVLSVKSDCTKYTQSTQTESSENIDQLKKEIERLQEKVRILEDHNGKLVQELSESEKKWHDSFLQRNSEMLSSNQMKLLTGKAKQVKWTMKDLAKAFFLKLALGNNKYTLIRKELKFPLPCLSTLKNHVNKFQITPGVLQNVIEIIGQQYKDRSDLEKVVVLKFDETFVSQEINFDTKNDCILGPFKKIQIIQMFGIISGIKQIVYANFDTDINEDILKEVIIGLHAQKFSVVALTSDNAAANVAVWTKLGGGKHFYLHPVTKRRIFFISDPPHLIKLLRNHLLDGGFVTPDGQKFTSAPLQKLITNHANDLSLHINKEHLEVSGLKRQNVRKACELLSKTTARLLMQEFPHDTEARNLSEFIRNSNDLFDILNSSSKNVNEMYTASNEQINFLNRISAYFSNIKSITPRGNIKKVQLPCQKGLLMSIKSLQDLYIDLKNEYNLDRLPTIPLNNDSLERTFGSLREYGLYNCPGPLEMLNRLRLHILSNTKSVEREKSNIMASEQRNDIESDENGEIEFNICEFLNSAGHKTSTGIFNSLDSRECTESDQNEIILDSEGYDSSLKFAKTFRKKFLWTVDEHGNASDKYVYISNKLDQIYAQIHGNSLCSSKFKQNIVQMTIKHAIKGLEANNINIHEEALDENFLKEYFTLKIHENVKAANYQMASDRAVKKKI